ncbi:MAG: hypothetical protein QXV22_03215 [Thermoplasmataceae archaeon]
MTAQNFRDCFHHLEDSEESAAECIHCLRKFGEQVFYDPAMARLRLGREMYDSSVIEMMERITNALGIRNREDYEKMDRKYNLTMY